MLIQVDVRKYSLFLLFRSTLFSIYMYCRIFLVSDFGESHRLMEGGSVFENFSPLRDNF